MDLKVEDIAYNRSHTSYGYKIDFDVRYWLKWHNQYWSISLLLSALYIVFVFVGQKLMENRKPFNLRIHLSVWSGALAIFSILGAFKMVPEFISALSNEGLHGAICRSSYVHSAEQLFWHWLFVWSKLIEFGDTAFIILRRQKLSFLHVYHHALTLICVFCFFPATVGINRWTGTMNYFVHSVMYSYYSAKAMRINFPKFIPMFITSIQILQMFVGLFASSYALGSKLSNYHCNLTIGQALFVFA
ncbi:elongation of very long chain fatty acids protein 6-like protein, partial [Dinothrombium tinctorium]